MLYISNSSICFQGDVVVLEGISLSGVGDEGVGPEDAGYCDIEFINSSGRNCNSSTTTTIMAATAVSYSNAKAANDFSTVLLRHSGEFTLFIEGAESNFISISSI